MNVAIQSVIFDIGNVLIRWDPRNVFTEVFNGDEAALAYFLSDVCSPEWNKEIDAGKTFDQAVKERQALFPDYAEQIAMWRDRWPETLGGSIDGTVKILKTLKDQGTPLYGLSNWSAETFPYAREHFPFLSLLEDVVVSGEVKAAKPDAKIFEIFLERHPIDARTAVFIDDSKPNLLTAETFGIRGIHFTTPTELKRDLQFMGILPN